VLYLRYYWQVPADHLISLFQIFLMLLLITYSICIANMSMLELLQQSERSEELSFRKALKETVFSDALHAIPIAIIWAVMWFVILVLQALRRRQQSASATQTQRSLQDAALTLGGMNGESFSWFRLGLDMIEKLIRLIAFLSLPAIAWEDKGAFQALKRAFQIIRENPIQFLATYTLTSVASGIMLLPLIPIWLAAKAGVHISDVIWTIVIIYEGITWSLTVYLEQMTLGLLYIQHVNTATSGSVSPSIPNTEILENILDKNNTEILTQKDDPPLIPEKYVEQLGVVLPTFLKWGSVILILLIGAIIVAIGK
jgi:hypothetical protein